MIFLKNKIILLHSFLSTKAWASMRFIILWFEFKCILKFFINRCPWKNRKLVKGKIEHIRNLGKCMNINIFCTSIMQKAMLYSNFLKQKSSTGSCEGRCFSFAECQGRKSKIPKHFPSLTILTGKDWYLTQFSTGMARWLLLTFFICLHNQLSSIHPIISTDVWKMWFIK